LWCFILLNSSIIVRNRQNEAFRCAKNP
jgi:hypothetical protein